MKKQTISRLDYSQFLLTSQGNYTITYHAEHLDNVSHDTINRYLLKEKLSPHLLWEHVQQELIPSENGVIIFDDTVLDKSDSRAIELTRWQYSGTAKKVIRGIGLVNCIYYNPEANRYWAIYPSHLKIKKKIDNLALWTNEVSNQA